jgi:hypothetical protein
VAPTHLRVGDGLDDRLVGHAEVHRAAQVAERRLVEKQPGAGDRIRDRLGRLLRREQLVLDEANHPHRGLDLDRLRRNFVGRHRVVAAEDVVGVQLVASQPGGLQALEGLLLGLVVGILEGGAEVPEVPLRRPVLVISLRLPPP